MIGRSRVVLLLLAAALALGACRSPEQRLADRRRELREKLDRLYAKYGEGRAETQGEPGKGAEGGGLVGRVLQEADRSWFEQHCLAVGRGERPFSLSGNLDAFVKDNAGECREAADLQLEIDALAREAAAR